MEQEVAARMRAALSRYQDVVAELRELGQQLHEAGQDAKFEQAVHELDRRIAAELGETEATLWAQVKPA